MRFIPSTEGPQVRDRHGVTIAESEAIHNELEAAERIAEHTGHSEYDLADRIADALSTPERRLTTADRLLIANELTK
jgi:hypothetical protein